VKERRLIAELLRPLATSRAARGLADDAAVWQPPRGRELVLTHDMLVCGIHYLPNDPPGDIALKLLAVNLSDIAAMGARPAGILLGLGLSPAEDDAWLDAFVAGLALGLARWALPLWGGDTVSGLAHAVLGLTAIGSVAPGAALSRDGARPGDGLYVSGTIGDAGLGLAVARGALAHDGYLLRRFRLPEPRLALGASLVGVATAAMDVSDGLLIDAERLAAASGITATIDLAALPLSRQAAALTPGDVERLERAAAGDDYELLFTLPPGTVPPAHTTRIGLITAGAGLTVIGSDGRPLVPPRLGFEH